MSPRNAVIALAVIVATMLQVSVLPRWSVQGVAPDLVLLVVVATALAHGCEVAMITGFGAGLLLDLMPPADHVAGRWALALLAVGYVAGRLSAADSPRFAPSVAVAVACSFVGTSVFALSGIALRDPSVAVGELLHVVSIALVFDLVAALVVIWLVLALFARADPDRTHAFA